MSRVVIVEPVRLFRDSLVAALGAQWPDRRIDGFPDVSEAHACADFTGNELLLISAIELDRRIQPLVKKGLSALPDAVPVMLLDRFDMNRAADAVAAGVRGFIQKSAPIGVLAGALDMVLDGDVYFPSIAMGEAYKKSAPFDRERPRVRHISPRQHEVLELDGRRHDQCRHCFEPGHQGIDGEEPRSGHPPYLQRGQPDTGSRGCRPRRAWSRRHCRAGMISLNRSLHGGHT